MENWIEITAFYEQYKALMAKSMLEASGVEAVLRDEMMVQMNNFYANAVGGIRLFVPKEKAREALLLLEEGGFIDKPQTKSAKLEIFSKAQGDICPYCHSDNTVVKQNDGFSVPFLCRRYHCYDCSREWDERRL